MRKRPISQYDKTGALVQHFASASAAEKELGIARPNIINCCMGDRHTAGDYIFLYSNDPTINERLQLLPETTKRAKDSRIIVIYCHQAFQLLCKTKEEAQRDSGMSKIAFENALAASPFFSDSRIIAYKRDVSKIKLQATMRHLKIEKMKRDEKEKKAKEAVKKISRQMDDDDLDNFDPSDF